MAGKRRDIDAIKKIIIHCSDTDNPEHDDIEVIRAWHIRLGDLDVAYHWFITKDGTMQKGRELYEIGAHCKGHNVDSVGVCLSGRNQFTEKQFKSCAIIVRDLFEILNFKRRFNKFEHLVYPHNYFNKLKTCPNFDVSRILKISNTQIIDDILKPSLRTKGE